MIKVIQKSKDLVLDIKVLKSHLRIEHSHEDEYLKVLIEAATEILEKKMGMSILNKKYKYTGDPSDPIPIYPITKVFAKKDGEFCAGIAESSSEVPSDIMYAVLQVAKNMYECNNDENILESQYIRHVIGIYKPLNIN
ncbi:MAG: head-tail connector protein [Holosporales bacterium]|jgi:hypothetical protein|nr:head-tail connector protein [Holosporales bacterium]